MSARSLSAAPVGEGVDAPRAVGPGCVAELHRLGVGKAHDRRRVEAHTDREALGQRLVRRLGGEDGRRRVMGRDTGRVAARLHEISLKLRRDRRLRVPGGLDPSAERP